MKWIFSCVFTGVMCLTEMVAAQKVTRFTVTDNLNVNGRFTPGKAKPAAPRDTFYLLSEKGTQVLFFADLQNTDSTSLVYPSLKFTAYKQINGKFEWVEDKVLDIKTNDEYVMSAFNFYSTGSYKLVITPLNSSEILAESAFTVVK